MQSLALGVQWLVSVSQLFKTLHSSNELHNSRSYGFSFADGLYFSSTQSKEYSQKGVHSRKEIHIIDWG